MPKIKKKKNTYTHEYIIILNLIYLKQYIISFSSVGFLFFTAFNDQAKQLNNTWHNYEKIQNIVFNLELKKVRLFF